MAEAMRVEAGTIDDVEPWLTLALEVEPLFGPMLHDNRFRDVLVRNIERSTAFCVRPDEGSSTVSLLGGILVSLPRPDFRINWLAVTSSRRRSGFGRALVEHVLRPLPAGTIVSVVTFTEDAEGGRAAHYFYERLGFVAAELTTFGEDGGKRRILRRTL